MPVPQSESNEFESSLNLQTFLLFMVAITVGLLVAVVLLPSWLPNLAFSLGSQEPKAFWYLSRATAFVSLGLLWLSMALGLGITSKLARLWPGAPAAFALHEYVSLLGLAFALFHALVILGDKYIQFTLVQLLVPFSTADYKPVWVGLGQIGFYTWALVAASFYVRRTIGQKTWRAFHYLTFGLYFLALFHGLFSGSDSSLGWAQQFYWFSSASLLFLSFVRLLTALFDHFLPEHKQRPTPAARPSLGS